MIEAIGLAEENVDKGLLENLVCNLNSSSLVLRWEVEEIFTGWFLNHKKHRPRSPSSDLGGELRSFESTFSSEFGDEERPSSEDDPTEEISHSTPSRNFRLYLLWEFQPKSSLRMAALHIINVVITRWKSLLHEPLRTFSGPISRQTTHLQELMEVIHSSPVQNRLRLMTSRSSSTLSVLLLR
ncbi:hypothetical protein R1flu_000615 [Riccia fluitans]|uniref:Uncharacterized protein n=1 Tax=Riccia fluitans TaxID=41844 RepID=A0ABD1Y0Z2_9MARC